MNRIINLAIIFAILSPHVSLGQSLITLDSIMRRIDASNPSLKVFDMNIESMKAYAGMSRSWMPPSFSTGLWQTPYSDFKSGMWMVSATQMIPNSRQVKTQYSFMQSMTNAENYARISKRNDLVFKAKTAYAEWVILKRKYIALSDLISSMNDALNLAQSRYSYNKEKLSNIYMLKADIADTRSMLISLASEIEVKNMELDLLMGLDPFVKFDVDTLLPSAILTRDADVKSISDKADLLKLDASIATLKLKQDYERSKALPEFGFSLNHMQSLGMMPNQYSVMAMMNIPIGSLSSREYKSKVNGIRYEINAMELEKESMRVEANGNIAIMKLRASAMEREIANIRDTVMLNYKNAYASSLSGYEQNTEELDMVLGLAKIYRQVRLTELDKEMEYYKMLLELDREQK
jgi:cobalt-zinc-cadmium efflux system outer membrane protein